MSARLSSTPPRPPSGARAVLAVPVHSLDPTERTPSPSLERSSGGSEARSRAKARLAAVLRGGRDDSGSDGELSRASSADEEDNVPEVECKFDDADLLHTKTPLLTGSSVSAKREEIRAYFHKTFSLYERLFDVLASDESYAQQPEKLRHPLCFYHGHTAVFFINKLRLAGLLSGRINEGLESTLAIGVDEMSWDDTNSTNYVWPTVGQVRAYRDLCRVVVDDLISSLPLSLPIEWNSPFWIILMGCEHERIHLETSSVLFRQLPLEHVKVPALLPMMWSPSAQFRSERSQVPRNTLVPVRGGMVVAGNSSERHRVYGWDLEYGTHVAEVGSFSAAKFLVSNAEFFEFVQEGGYEDQSLWGEEGAKFVAYRNAKHPVFWRPLESSDEEEPRAPSSSEEEDGGISASSKALSSPPRFLYRSMTTEMSMPWDWPVDVNYIEAKAFCAWKNRQRAERGEDKDGLVYRLPTEDEYFRLRDQFFPADIEVVIDERTGERARVPNDQPDWHTAPGNINLEHGASSCPVDRFAFPPVAVSSSSSSDPAAAAVTEAGKAEDQEDRLYDVVGNVWQWTETPLMPFRGFRFHPMYDDFSVPTFDTRHNVIVGGSWISTGNEATRTARFAFRRHFYQHAGFRYILAPPLREGNNAPQQNMCETDPAVVAMMDAQFNDAAQVALARNLHMQPQPNYAARIAQIAFEAYKNYGTTGTPLVADDALGAAAASATGERNGASSSSSSPAPTTLASPGPRALDIGCACGRSTFELAKLAAARGDGSAAAPVFNHILGLDFSTRFIRIAAQLQFEGHAEYSMAKEGNLLSYHSIESQADAPPAHMLAAGSDAASSSSSSSSATAAGAVGRVDLTVSTAPSVLDLDLARLGMRHRVEFLQGDACNLASKYTGFDLVLASNLLEFLYTPRLFLEGIGARMRRGGILVLSSSYGWSEQEGGTPKDHWLGGFKDATGESVDSARAIADILTAKDAFEPIHAASQELPVIWKQNQRHYALRFAHVTVWRKK